MLDHGRTAVIASTFVEQNAKYLKLDQLSHTIILNEFYLERIRPPIAARGVNHV